MASYFDQFNLIAIFSTYVTNSSLVMITTVVVCWVLFKNHRLVPYRWQSVIEIVYDHFVGVVKDSLGVRGYRFLPFVFTLFLFIAWLNVLGLFPYIFTATVHIVVTFGLSFTIVICVTILGFINFRSRFLSMLMPSGAPLLLAPLLVLIETVSYVARAISLGVRLAANLSAGHLLFAILASFGFQMVVNQMYLLSLFPVLIMVFITMLEMAVALIQAYVFCLLTTIYLGDTLALH
uniref:ATP synthase subunit a n=1 Tax=Craspedacusta sowerbii TaxID=128124 RepID=J7EXL0_CRASO|nr:ATP synthase F0 subunit 6 [Craspedacusta sowerbii]AEO93241.1 ATP synthase F0 subunit 6 [Craspedacusta sowerbii]QXT43883.1 ATP synthase F0 subunit 6 [Craspedacusta sowerbii]QXT43898.1 ATP synthase F0 subunit 6 [Craspedacusta sowerbii]CUS58528.1 TPA: ATP synthase F0 subunit 6 [Craspedacusta sowerbii]